jgi:transketolase
MNNVIKEYDLFIFDLDDTIIKTEHYHYNAWLKVLKNKVDINFSISFEYFCEKFHSKDPESIKKYIVNQLNLENYNDIVIEKQNTYLNILNENINKLKLIDGLEDFLKLILKYNKKFIIVSNSFKSSIDFFLDNFPILKESSKIYYREMFTNKKPNPECYLKVINDFPNTKKIGFEDSITGIEALVKSKLITSVFINTPKYIHYNYIINNYPNIIPITDYSELNNYYIENKIINTLRILSVDMIEKANSGHPGMPLGCAPMMYVLWCKIMNFNPDNPLWKERDRFILSNGHGCALLYSMLYLLGYDYTLEDLQKFRQLHSKTPGHPEYNKSLGIEMSTGPLGQGIANGVGMAISSKKLKYKNNIYVMCGDGCLMEGISYEACSIAGHLGLNNLIILYDDNGITIDGTTEITFTENTRQRFIALNWNVLEVKNGDTDINDIYNKIVYAKKMTDKPTIIFVKTTIGYGSNNSGSSSVHGAPLGIENTKSLKTYFNFDENKSFFIDDDIKEYFKKFKNTKKIYYEQLDKNNLEEINNEIYINNTIIELSSIKNGIKNYATRDISNILLNILVKNNPNIIVGSADLAESNKTAISSSFLKKDNFEGQYLHYGIREHAMCAIANGISTYNLIPVVSTFLVFITYCLAPIRMAALSNHKAIYIFTHDSVFLGEDGPTHQPIESLSILRTIPNLLTIRPCDVNETNGAYQVALKHNGPIALILSRQVLPNINNSNIENINKGAYIVYELDATKIPDLIIVATGSEVSLAIDVAILLKDEILIKVVSMPCCELYDLQSEDYKKTILPKNIKKMSLEAGCTIGWYKYVDYVYGIDGFGESGKINDLKEYFGFNVNNIKEYILNNLINN